MLVKKKSACRITVRSARVLIENDLVQFLPSQSGMMFTDPSCHTIRVVLAVPGQVEWPETGQIIQAQELSRQYHDEIIHERNRIVVDADCLSAPLIVRAWRSGDRFHPFGMQGRSKKLQDFFTDLKVASAARKRIPVVAAPEGIVWVVGYRQDERWSLSASTRRCIVLSTKMFKPREGS